MKIEKSTVVTLNYELHTSKNKQEKTFVEKTSTENPFVFLFGTGGLIQDFEKNISGLSVGEKFSFDIEAMNAYGNFDMEAIVKIPKDAFQGPDGKPDLNTLVVGKIVPMMDNEGHHLQGKILEVNEADVLMDFNHPLAGKDLHFSGEVLNIREATSEEIAHGHVHDGKHHH